MSSMVSLNDSRQRTNRFTIIGINIDTPLIEPAKLFFIAKLLLHWKVIAESGMNKY